MDTLGNGLLYCHIVREYTEGMQTERMEGVSSGLRGQLPIPLNSKRLAAIHLKRLAKALSLAMSAATEEVRQMVEGKLAEQGREPLNVQVVLKTTPRDAFSFQDAERTFLTVEAEEDNMVVDDPQSLHRSDAAGSGEEIQSLKQELESVKAENVDVHQQLDHERMRRRELWRVNCQSLAEYDKLLV